MLFRGPAAEQRSPHNSRVLIFSWPFLREQTNPPQMERGGVIKLRGREQFVKGLAGTFGFLERRLASSSAALRCLPLLDASSDIVPALHRELLGHLLPVCSSRATSSRSSTRVGFLVSDELAVRVVAIDDPAVVDSRFCYFCLLGTSILATLTLHRWMCVGQKSDNLI